MQKWCFVGSYVPLGDVTVARKRRTHQCIFFLRTRRKTRVLQRRQRIFLRTRRSRILRARRHRQRNGAFS